MDAPTIRSSMCKSVLEAVDGLGEARAKAILHLYGDERLAEVENAGPFAWLDWGHAGALNDAIAGELGEEATLRFWQAVALKSMQQSAFKAIVDTAFRLMGRTPAALLNYWHLGYKVAAKHHGTMEARIEEEGEALVIFHDVPRVILRGSFVHAHRGSLLAGCSMLGLEGETRVVHYDRDEGVLDVLVRWSPGGEATR